MRRLFPIFFISMGISGILSFFWVYRSNLGLQKELMVLTQAGHTVVPNHHVLPSLSQFFPALYSSLFISLTAGVFLSLFTCCCIFVFHVFSKNRHRTCHPHISFLIFLLAAVMLMGVFLADRSIFHRVRDYVLLPHPVGISITNFYYTYSPYAAHAVARPIDKTVKSCWISPDIPEKNHLAVILARFGWLAVENRQETMFTIERLPGRQLGFQHNGDPVVSVSRDTFFLQPEHLLQQYSKAIDHARFIRTLSAAGLFFGLPLTGIPGLFFCFMWVAGKIMPQPYPVVASAIFSAGAVAAILLLLYPPAAPDSVEKARKMLASENTKHRIEAIRMLYRSNQISSVETVFPGQLDECNIAERYWIAKALSKSDTQQSIHTLKKLAADPAPIVAKAAIKSLGARSCDTDTVDLFKHQISDSPHWYVQIAAWNAVKKCP
jgi:hypothetical protein